MYPNYEMQAIADRAVSENTTYERYPRVVPQQIDYQPDSPLPLRIISLPKSESISEIDEYAQSTEYTYESSLGEGIFIYQFDNGFDLSHPVSAPLVRSSSFTSSPPDLLLAHSLRLGIFYFEL